MAQSRPAVGRGTIIRGELSATEDVTIDGYVEGRITVPDHRIVVGTNARLNAEVFARAVTILGVATGQFTAAELVEIAEGATVEGRIVAPRVAMADGAYFKGTIDPNRAEAAVRVARYRLEQKVAQEA